MSLLFGCGSVRVGAHFRTGKVMKEHNQGTHESGSGKEVKSRKQAVSIALSEARKSGAKVPKR